jgi:hypothetical protein
MSRSVGLFSVFLLAVASLFPALAKEKRHSCCIPVYSEDKTASNHAGDLYFEGFHLLGDPCASRARAVVVPLHMFPSADAGAAQSSAGAMPNPQMPDRPHLVELTSANWRPLSGSEKFAFFWKDLLRWETHTSLALDSAITYANGGRSYLGAGGKKYLRIYGLDAADEENFTFFSAFLFPWIFHEDPRYIPLGHGSTGKRLKYALSRIIVTRNDAGHEEINKSGILGTIIATSLSSAYYSACGADVSIGGNFAGIGTNLASGAGFNVLKELWPEAARKLKINLWIRSLVTDSIRDKIRIQ